MSEYILQIKKLQHHFGKQKVLNNLSINVPEGSIYGFLGQNGAGKTTTMQLVLGLKKKQEGEIHIFEKRIDENRIDILNSIGSLIESPSIYNHLTAFENLLIWQKIYRTQKSAIDEKLALVGLNETGSKKAGNFSLGMKQRLGLAIALIHNPSLLVLDEPTNGLDPNGIIEMRDLLLKLNSEQKITIFISSHLLSEIDKLVTHVGMIHNGNMLFEGTLQELKHKQNSSSVIRIKTDDLPKTKAVLGQFKISQETTEFIEFFVSDNATIAQIVKLLIAQEIDIYEVSKRGNELEDIFMNLIN